MSFNKKDSLIALCGLVTGLMVINTNSVEAANWSWNNNFNLSPTIVPIDPLANIDLEGLLERPFKIKVKTNNFGTSSDTQYIIPAETGRSSGGLYNVDCESDGILEANSVTGNYTCDYAVPGTYVISISGDFSQIYHGNGVYPIPNNDPEKLLSVEQWGTAKWQTMYNAFYGCKNLIVNAIDQPDLSRVTDMANMFANTEVFNQDISQWDVSNVTVMDGMFEGAKSFNKNIAQWDVSNVTNMAALFNGAESFNQDISQWDVGNVTNMWRLFGGATAFNQDISSWNVDKVEAMGSMFRGAIAFNQDLGNWNISNVRSMQDMFLDATLSINNYENTLYGWVTNGVNRDIDFHGGNSQYRPNLWARYALKNYYNWSISDGGPNNLPPISRPDRVTIEKNRPVIIDVLANDTDPDGDNLMIQSIFSGNPSNGTMKIVSNKIKYTPNYGYSGYDVFFYTVRDGHGNFTKKTSVRVYVRR